MQLSAAKSLQSAAVSAMYTMLPFVALNFEEPARQGERDAIMMAICTSTTSEDVEVKRKAFLCVEKTAELYYEFLKSYMKVLADLTSVAARSSDEQIAVSAIGFWSEISNHEAEAEQGQDQGFTQAALTPLISMLTDIMSSALEETDGSDDVADNLVAEAAQACLQNVSGAVRDKVVDPIMTFINQNFLSPDWKKRDAAIMAFGCIMEGPDETLLRKNYIPGVLPHLAARLKGGASTDPSVTVRSSAAFTLANIFEHHAEVLDLKTQFLPILAGLCTALEDVPLVVVQVTRAIDNLVASCSQFEHWTTKVNGMEATIMSQALYPTINALISRADKPDAAESGIRKNSFNAISTIVDNGAEADNAVFLSLATDAVNRLNLSLQRLQAATSKEARELEINVQSGICGMLSDVIFKLQDKIWVQCDAIMGTLLHFLNAKAVAEDVWMCVGALSSTMPPPNSPEVAPAGAAAAAHVSIMRYIEPLWPLLMGYLKNWSEVEACGATIRATQFIVPAMGPALTQRAPELVTAVLAVLMDAQVDRILKPDALSTLGDIAQALGPAIHPYLPAMHSVIAGAAQFVSDSVRTRCPCSAPIPRADADARSPTSMLSTPSLIALQEDMQEYVNDIRTSCLEAWTYIIAAFSSTLDEAPAVKANKQNIAAQNLTSLAAVAPGQPGANLVNDIVAVILSWTVGWKAAEDGLNPDHVISAVALLGDLGCAVGPRVLQERQISCSRTPELVWLLSKAEDCERAKAEEEGDVFDKKNGKAYYARKYLPK